MGIISGDISAAKVLGKGFCGKRQIIKPGSKYAVKDFLNGEISYYDTSEEVSEDIGISKSNVSTYCRNKNVFRGRYRIEIQGQENWKTDMRKVKVPMKNI